MNKIETVAGIEYKRPQIYLLKDTGIGTSEFAARTAYDSFDKAEDESIKALNKAIEHNMEPDTNSFYDIADDASEIFDSKLLSQLAWVHHHHSVIEHASLTFAIKNISRGVLQELVRHRIASYTVRSTRYTMSPVINAFLASMKSGSSRSWFVDKCKTFDMLAVTDEIYQNYEFSAIWDKLMYQLLQITQDEFLKISLTPNQQEDFNSDTDPDTLFDRLQNRKQKRNVGDNFKHIVSDNWSTDLVITINLRSLKNFFQLRDSGSAWFQIRWLAEELANITPRTYLRLIHKKYKDA